MSVRRNRRPLFLAGVCLVLAALACNAPGPATPTGVPAVPTVPQAEEASPTPSPSPAPTNTPVPDISGPGGCTLNGAYVADVTAPDNTTFGPGVTFAKVWRLRNSGTCAWEAGTQLVFVSGERMDGPAAVDLPAVTPGSTTDVSVTLVTPDEPGTYRSTWQLQSPEGVRFGSRVYVQIIVPEPTTETPTPTREPGLPDLIVANLEVDTSDPRQGVPLYIVATLRNQGSEVAEDFRWAWRVCVHEDCEYTEAPGTFTLGPGKETVARMEYLFDGWATYTTEAWVDSREEIEEGDETNNTHLMLLSVKPSLPDLVISVIAFDPDPPIEGLDATVQVGVHNRGSKPAAAFDVEWWAGVNYPAPACEWTLAGGLVEGGTVTLDCTYAYPSWYGSITTRAIADVNDDVTEADEANNTLDRDTPVSKP
jgi:hypothetical protein